MATEYYWGASYQLALDSGNRTNCTSGKTTHWLFATWLSACSYVHVRKSSMPSWVYLDALISGLHHFSLHPRHSWFLVNRPVFFRRVASLPVLYSALLSQPNFFLAFLSKTLFSQLPGSQTGNWFPILLNTWRESSQFAIPWQTSEFASNMLSLVSHAPPDRGKIMWNPFSYSIE